MGHTLSTRSIRTFVLRQGRLTEGQQKSLDQYWPEFGVEVIADTRLNLDKCFNRTAPVWLEVGFGNGEALVEMAKAHPEINFLGVEVHLPGVGHVLGEIANHQVTNVRIIRYDALELLEHQIEAGSVERLSLFFPDPWHKKRHHKRRIVNPEFLKLAANVLTDHALVHIATDWESYALHIEQVLTDSELFTRIECGDLFDHVTSARPGTKFEQRGIKLGHTVTDLVYQKTK